MRQLCANFDTSQAGWQFVESAEVGPIGTYRCTHAGRTVTCTNRVGDSFRYTP